MAEKPPYIKPPEKRSVPTTNKAEVLKLARKSGIQTIHARYRDIKDALKNVFSAKPVAQAPPQKPVERQEDPMQSFMRRELAAKATAAQTTPPTTILPSGGAETKPRPPSQSTSNRSGGGGRALPIVTLDVCHVGLPMYRNFNASDPFE